MPNPNCDAPATASPAAQDGACDLVEDRARLVLPARLCCGSVPQHDMTDLVRHDAGDLTFGVRAFDHAAIDEHGPPGKADALICGR